ncbi:MAG: phage tail protein [Methanothrix sp.]
MESRFRALTVEDWKWLSEGDLVADETGRLSLRDAKKYGSHKFGLLDSGQFDCIWHRIAIDAEIPENASISFSFRVSNDGKSFGPSGEVTLKEGERDALLMSQDRGEIKGKFIELTVRLRSESGETPRLTQILVCYPRDSYLRYLPAAYQEDEASRRFLERFLSIFESDLQESEDLISNIPSFLDPISAPSSFLPWLADWLALDLYELMGERNREYLAKAVELYKWKGTARGLRALVETLTGRRCCVREFGKNIFRTYGMESMEEERVGDLSAGGECGSTIRRISRTVDADKMNRSSMGTFHDDLHYVTDTRSDGLYSSNTVGIYILLVGNEGLPVDRDDLHRIIESFLPVYVRARIFIENLEPTRRSHPTDLISERVGIAITKRTRERTGLFSLSHKDGVSFTVLKSYSAEAGGITNSPQSRTYHRGVYHRGMTAEEYLEVIT